MKRCFSLIRYFASTPQKNFADLPEVQLPLDMPVGVSCRMREKAGRSLFTTKAFRRGESIIIEDPLFVLHGNDFISWLPQFARLPKTIRHLATEVLYVPSLELVRAMVPPASREQSILPFIESLNSASNNDGLNAAERTRAILMLTALAFASDQLYVFPIISLVNHTCGEANAMVLENTLIATRDIQNGEELFLNYHAGNLLMDRDSRRYRLRLTKYFECNCVRCTTGVDWTGGLPCPSCNSRDQKGLLKEVTDATVYRDLSKEGEPWTCNHCNDSFSNDAFGTSNPAVRLENSGARYEKIYDFVKAAERAACSSYHGFLMSGYDASKLESSVLGSEYVERVLGRHHWAFHILSAICALQESSFDRLRLAALQGSAWAQESPPNTLYRASQDIHFNQVLLRLLQHQSVHLRNDLTLRKLEATFLKDNLSLPNFRP